MNLFIQSKKWLLLFFCFFLGFSGLTQGAESTFRFSPDWQEGDTVDYDFSHTSKINIAEYPLLSGSWIDINGQLRYQILSKTKNEFTLKNQMRNVSVSSPTFFMLDSLLPASSPVKGISNTLPQDLSNLLSSLQFSYVIDKKGQVVRYHNIEDLEVFWNQYFDLLSKYTNPNAFPTDAKENFLDTLKKESNEPQNGHGIHDPLFYERKIKIGKVQNFPYIIRFPDSNFEEKKFSLPGNYEAMEEDSKITIRQTCHLDNDDGYKLLTEIIKSSSSKNEAEAFIQNWETLKAMGVIAHSAMTLKNTYELPKKGKWPLKIQTVLYWDFSADIKSLKMLGIEELKNYPDTLHIKMEFTTDQKLKEEHHLGMQIQNKGGK